MISSIGNTPFPATRCGNECARPASRDAGTAVALTVATAERSVDGKLSLTTKEGDTVTISAHADATVTYAALRGRSTDGRFAARYVSLEANRELSVEVQGDLSEEELAEIRKVVKAFFHELRDAFRGRDADVGEVSAAGDGASTLAGFSVHLESSSSVSVVSVVARPRPGAQPLPVAPAADEDSAAASASAETALPSVDVPRTLGRLLTVARGAHVAPERLGRALDRVFGQFARSLRHDGARAALELLRQGVKQGVSEDAPKDAAPVDVPAEPLAVS